MQSILDTLTGLLKNEAVLSQFGQLIGSTDDRAIKRGIIGGTSAFISVLAKKAAEPGGAAHVFDFLAKTDGGLIDNIPGFLANPSIASGVAVMEGILGNAQNITETKIARTSGLSEGVIGRLLPTLAPIIASAISNLIKTEALSPADLAKFLKEQEGFMRTLSPGLIGFFEKIDANDDNSVLDDLSRLADRLFSR